MYRVNGRVSIVPGDVMERLGALSVPVIGDAMGRYGCMNYQIKPLSDAFKVAGPALTVQTYRADNLMIHAALEMAHEGDILVVDACGFCDTGLWGSLMTRMAIARKLGGIVLDGAARDKLEVIELGFPVFCRGVSPMGGFKDSPGSVNVPVSCGGVPVSPGDVIVGDADGVVVVPSGRALEIAESARRTSDKEISFQKGIAEGKSLFDLLNLGESLEKLGIKKL
ncbi:MAG: 4-carboxy-4-hydroxy-2-oxoadipate aldolase/oxaloacetate decarboxylase [Synergistaceae bacterium]|jgi:4-hydroxy-4-methyl-2-oxoglutarate aldolase|nr:4-carboxy-4-hydroxy-2-oxoadipate aldolase/oxaloacetate decarboxylase [Synergistaceae bacterium]